MHTCVYCNFTTRKKGNYNAHLLTSKHIGRTFTQMRKQQLQTHPVVWVRRTQPGTTFGGAEAKLPSELVVESGVHRTPTLECEALREKLRFSDQSSPCCAKTKSHLKCKSVNFLSIYII